MIGYVVVEINQASGRIERLESDVIHSSREAADETAGWSAEDAARRGRRERYIVCEVIPVEDGDDGT
jgi:hypothetical protein